MTRQPARVLTIPFGVDFISALAQALFEGPLRELIDFHGDPLTIASATIYVPTRRAARALADSIAQRLGGRAALLPRIAPLGETDALELRALADTRPTLIPPAINEMQRLMLLTRLVAHWSSAVDRDKLKLDEDEAFTVASGSAGVISLAGDLARLIDGMHLEAVSLESLKRLDATDFQEMWRISASFLAIAGESWPRILAERNQTDASDRHSRLLRAEAARLMREGSAQPVIAAGSTGTIEATAELLKAVARLPNGALVLPGLDRNLDARSWSLLEGDDANPSHPQHALRKLLDRVGVTPQEVEEIGAAPPAIAARSRLLTEAMRPAETSDAWGVLGGIENGLAEDADYGLAEMAVIEAPDERMEALAIALVLREAVEAPGNTAALITPDRGLAERVAIELTRWGITADDSAGTALSRTPAGRLALVLANIAASGFEAQSLLALLAHPATHFGLDRQTVERGTAAIEIALLRGRPAPSDPPTLRAALLAARTEDIARAPEARARLVAADFDAAASVIDAIASALVGLHISAARSAATLPALTEAHRAALTSVARLPNDSSALDGADAQALTALFADLAECGDPGAEMSSDAFPQALRALMDERSVAAPSTGHRRIKIWGLLEARLLSADVVVLGGLVEGKWPARPTTDPFLNRAMRQQLGLGAPERRIGQMAHDFVLACGAARCILTRPLKADGGETIPSRLLQRLEAVAGAGRWRDARMRGARFLALANQLDTPRRRGGVSQPSPLVLPELQPWQLSVTGVETLLRDPYAIFARHVLRLNRLEPLGFAFDARLQGSIWHDALAAFVKAHPDSVPTKAYEELLRIGQELLSPHVEDPLVEGFVWPRFKRAARWFVDWDRKRRPALEAIAVETSSALPLALVDGTVFRLTARPDRVEKRKDGRFAIIDFKTGAPPAPRDVLSGFSPQLTLEAAILGQVGMAGWPAREVCELLYIKLTGGTEPGKENLIRPGDGGVPSIGDLAAHHLTGLRELLDAYRARRRGFTSRPFPVHAPTFSDYDHLARVAEWADEGASEAEAE